MPEDYVFDEATDAGVQQLNLSDLFADGQDTLILYNYMFGPNDKEPCVMCTSFADSANGAAQLSACNVFVKRDDGIYHFYSTEMLFVSIDGEDPRHMDLIFPLWNLFDLTPEGRGSDWHPCLKYD